MLSLQSRSFRRTKLRGLNSGDQDIPLLQRPFEHLGELAVAETRHDLDRAQQVTIGDPNMPTMAIAPEF